MGEFLEQEMSQKYSVSSQSGSSILNEYNISVNMSKSTGNLRSWIQQKFKRNRISSKTVVIRSTSAPNLGPKAIRYLMSENLQNGDCEIFF